MLSYSVKCCAHLVLGGEGALGALGLAAQLLQGTVVLTDVHLVLLLDELDEVVHDAVVKVLASQVRVAARRNDLRSSASTSAKTLGNCGNIVTRAAANY